MKKLLNTVARNWDAAIIGAVIGAFVALSASAASAQNWNDYSRMACPDMRAIISHTPGSPQWTCGAKAFHDWRIGQIMRLHPNTPYARVARYAWSCEYQARQNEQRLVDALTQPRPACVNDAYAQEALSFPVSN